MSFVNWFVDLRCDKICWLLILLISSELKKERAMTIEFALPSKLVVLWIIEILCMKSFSMGESCVNISKYFHSLHAWQRHTRSDFFFSGLCEYWVFSPNILNQQFFSQELFAFSSFLIFDDLGWIWNIFNFFVSVSSFLEI